MSSMLHAGLGFLQIQCGTTSTLIYSDSNQAVIAGPPTKLNSDAKKELSVIAGFPRRPGGF